MRTSSPRNDYLHQVFGIENPLLEKVRLALEASNKAGIQIGAAEARFLQFLIRAHRLKKIVEIGTLYGYSALAMADALPQDGHIWAVESQVEHADQAEEFFTQSPYRERISLHRGDALQVLPQLVEHAPFDLVFIDANKAGYLSYLDWADRYVRPGGFIVGDNTFLFGTVFGQESTQRVSQEALAVMRDFNHRLADRRKYNSVLIPTEEGLTVAQKI